MEHAAATSLDLRLERVTFRHPGAGAAVFEEFDYRFPGGKWGLLGDNGSGKTTLLHLLVGLHVPTRGRLLLDGREVRSRRDLRRLRQRVGLVFQQADDQLFCPTVLEDVAFGPLNLGATPRQAEAKARRTLARLGLAGFEHRLAHQLSGGEKRLIALATVLAMEPSLLLLDEPTNDLDRHSRDRLVQILQSLDIHLLVVSHDYDFLSQTVHHFALLEKGRIHTSPEARLHQHQHVHLLGGQRHHHHP